jgi:hypothetical protein
MRFQLRLIHIPSFIALSTILTMIIEFSIIIITKGSWFPLIYGLVVLGVIFLSMIISSFFSLTYKNVEITDQEITIGKKKLKFDSISFYYQDENFLFDGIRIKSNKNQNLYLTTINFYKKDKNFEILKHAIINRKIDYSFSIKTGDDLIRESKGLKYMSYVLMGLLALVFILTLFTDFKFSKIKFLYISLIALGIFVQTRSKK